ncbi:MAG TPA: preprotein translocase subunit YajC [Candidatus Angelobacter sp.]|nr:preprotein translocase subunit YajC [Candidatus Angelobacter sp.]
MGIGTILPLIIFFAIFYFLLIRPQQKKSKKTSEMQNSLGRGDKIVTIGGLHGVVDSIDEKSITIKCNGNTKLTFDRQAVREVLEQRTNPHEKKKEAVEAEAEEEQPKVDLEKE